ncbi:MAG TPA: hypothetical protein PLO43_03295, partial [Chlamydiales bacterium]|nr:hypothetical protein [Chlamydiales bacterium]
MSSPLTGPGASTHFQEEFMLLQMGNSQDAEPISEPASPSSAPVVPPSITDRFTGCYDLMRKIAMETSDPYEAANIMSNCAQFNLFNDESFWLEWSRRYLTVHGLKYVKSDVWLRCSSDSLGHRICKLCSLLFGTKASEVKDTFLNRASTVEKISRRLECAVGCGLEIAAVRLFREYGFRKKNKIISAALDQEQPHVAIELALEC